MDTQLALPLKPPATYGRFLGNLFKQQNGIICVIQQMPRNGFSINLYPEPQPVHSAQLASRADFEAALATALTLLTACSNEN